MDTHDTLIIISKEYQSDNYKEFLTLFAFGITFWPLEDRYKVILNDKKIAFGNKEHTTN